VCTPVRELADSRAGVCRLPRTPAREMANSHSAKVLFLVLFVAHITVFLLGFCMADPEERLAEVEGEELSSSSPSYTFTVDRLKDLVKELKSGNAASLVLL
jgi:hypothetical protein